MFHDRETAQLKKHEAFTAEREREIHQVSEDLCTWNVVITLC